MLATWDGFNQIDFDKFWFFSNENIKYGGLTQLEKDQLEQDRLERAIRMKAAKKVLGQ